MKKFYLFLALLIAISASLKPQTSGAQTRLADSTALLALYNNNGGANWKNSTNWLTTQPIDTWYGIHVSSTGRVDSVSLPGNGLVNAFPNIINTITNLAKFDVSNNALTGNMGYLSNDSLAFFNVAHNQLTGGIFFYNLPSMTVFRINNNGFSIGVGAVGAFPRIKVYNVSHNSFADPLPSFGSNFIDSVDLSYNHLTGAPDYFIYPNCAYYNISHNNLSGNWAAYPNFTSTALLDVSHNKFTFNEMEPLIFNNILPAKCTYAPQDTLLQLHLSGTKLTVTAGGTLGNNTYTWYNGSSVQSTKTGDSTYKVGAVGSYLANVTNSIVTGLTLYSDTLVLNSLPGTLTVAVSSITPASSCGNGSDGSIHILRTGGVAGFTFNLQKVGGGLKSQTGGIFNNIAPGTYNLMVSDMGGHIATLNGIVVTQAAPIVVTAKPYAATACTGSPDGKIFSSVTGGIYPFEYALTKQGGATITQRDKAAFGGLAAGTYSITVTDTAGCQGTLAGITITHAPAITIKGTATTVSVCGNDSDGVITTAIEGGVKPLEYNLAKPGSATATQWNNGVFNKLDTGLYTVTITDAVGCTATTAGVLVTKAAPIAIKIITSQMTACNYGNNIRVIERPTGGQAPYTYVLLDYYNNQPLYKPAGLKTGIFDNVDAGPYNTVVTDARGCNDTLNNVVVPYGPHPNFVDTTEKKPSCITAKDGTITVSAKGAKAPFVFILEDHNYGNDVFSPASEQNYTFTGLVDSVYHVVLQDANLCGAGYWDVNLATTTPCETGIADAVSTTNTVTGKAAGNLTVQVLPNPSKTVFILNINSAKNEPVEISVTDTYGRTVHRNHGPANQQYSFGETFAAGMYIARVMQGNEAKTIKLIKQ